MCSWFPHESNEYGMRDQFKRQIKCPRDWGPKREEKDLTGLLLRDQEALIRRRTSNISRPFVLIESRKPQM